jgi:hypothetical protein
MTKVVIKAKKSSARAGKKPAQPEPPIVAAVTSQEASELPRVQATASLSAAPRQIGRAAGSLDEEEVALLMERHYRHVTAQPAPNAPVTTAKDLVARLRAHAAALNMQTSEPSALADDLTAAACEIERLRGQKR